MAGKINRFRIGLFFLIGIGLILGGLIWAGAAHFFEPGDMYDTYFSQSVEGLSSGAEVNYLGIKVGRVISMSLAPPGHLVRVTMKVDPGFNIAQKSVQLKSKGITGGLYLALIQAPGDLAENTPNVTFPHRYPLIPAYTGGVSSMEGAVEKITKKIEALDLEGLVAAWKQTGLQAHQVLADKDIQRSLINIRQASADIKSLVGSVSTRINRQKLQKSVNQLEGATAAAEKGTKALASQLEGLPPDTVAGIIHQMDHVMVQMSQALADVKGLAHELKEQPGKVFVVPKSSDPFRR